MKYKYQPKNKKELIEAIEKEIYEVQGTPNNPNWEADLNCIDTSKITDMSDLFSIVSSLGKFNGDISKWNVRNVKTMEAVFHESKFNQDISKWDVSNVENMSYMFAFSKFNQDISNWNVSNVKKMDGMFFKSKFNKDISKWDVSNVENMGEMFCNSVFNQDISKWNISNVKNIEGMFEDSSFNKDIGNWPEELTIDTYLNNISANPNSKKLPDEIIYERTAKRVFKLYPEFAIINRTVRRYANKEIVKNLLRKYTDININKRILAKYSDVFSIDSFEKRVEWAYNNIANKEEREQVIAISVVIPYIQKNRNIEKKRRDDEIQIPAKD